MEWVTATEEHIGLPWDHSWNLVAIINQSPGGLLLIEFQHNGIDQCLWLKPEMVKYRKPNMYNEARIQVEPKPKM